MTAHVLRMAATRTSQTKSAAASMRSATVQQIVSPGRLPRRIHPTAALPDKLNSLRGGLPVGHKDTQIKHRDRVRDLAEVYTAAREVNAMLDLVAPVCRKLDTTFLEPACGNGNFLAEILRRKLERMHRPRGVAGLEKFEHQTLRALASIHGIDIDQDNVDESRERMRNIVNEHHSYKANSMRSSPEFRTAVDEILTSTIQLGDTLNGANQLTITEWLPTSGYGFERVLHNFDDMKNPDRIPLWDPVRLPEVHYTELGAAREEEAA